VVQFPLDGFYKDPNPNETLTDPYETPEARKNNKNSISIKA